MTLQEVFTVDVVDKWEDTININNQWLNSAINLIKKSNLNSPSERKQMIEEAKWLIAQSIKKFNSNNENIYLLWEKKDNLFSEWDAFPNDVNQTYNWAKEIFEIEYDKKISNLCDKLNNDVCAISDQVYYWAQSLSNDILRNLKMNISEDQYVSLSGDWKKEIENEDNNWIEDDNKILIAQNNMSLIEKWQQYYGTEAHKKRMREYNL